MFDWKNIQSAVPPPVSDVEFGKKADVDVEKKTNGDSLFETAKLVFGQLNPDNTFMNRKYEQEVDDITAEIMSGIKNFDDKTNMKAIHLLLQPISADDGRRNKIAVMKRIVVAVNNIYDPEKETVDPADSKVIYDLFPCMTGRKRGHGDELDIEEEAIDLLLDKTTFFSQAFTKQSALITDVAAHFWKKYDGNFSDWIKKEDVYLEKVFPEERGEKVERKGIDHILGNTLFGSRIMDLIPADQWNNHVMLALFIRSLHKDAPASYGERFVEKLEMIPSSMEKTNRANCLFGFLMDNHDENGEVLSADSCVGNFIHLMGCFKSKEMKSELSRFLHTAPKEFVTEIVSELKTDADYRTFVSLYATNAKGIEDMMAFQKPSCENVVWDLYARGKMPAELMEKMIKTAVRTKNMTFLMEPKKAPLTEKLPACRDIKGFLADMPHLALRFLNSFQDTGLNNEDKFKLAQAFIPSKAIQKKLVYRYQLVHQWAKQKSYHRISSFFFGVQADSNVSVVPTVSQKDIDLFWSQVDGDGKTLWHYLCEQKETTFFKRNFKVLHNSFLQVARQPDKYGKSPLDYANENLKFMQYVAEKIPAVTQLLSGTTYTLEHHSAPKIKEEPKEVVKPVVEVKTPVEAPKETWSISYYGSDSERKNPDYIQLIETMVEHLPPPKTSAMRQRMKKETKRDTYGIPAMKTHWNGRKWRIPYVVYDTTIFILPGADRDTAYAPKRGQYIRGVSAQLEKDLKSPTFIAHHTDKKPDADKINQKH